MPTYYCSPRAHWFEGMTDEDQMRLTACAPAVSPLLDHRQPISANPADWYHKISDADVERIAKRVAELLREAKP